MLGKADESEQVFSNQRRCCDGLTNGEDLGTSSESRGFVHGGSGNHHRPGAKIGIFHVNVQSLSTR